MNRRSIIDQINILKKKINDLNISSNVDVDLTSLTNSINLNTSNLSTNDYRGTTLIVDGSTGGTIAAGQLVYLSSSSVWTLAAANAVGFGENEILGTALSTTPSTTGILVNGLFKLNTSYINGGSFTVGAQVFMHPSTAGSYTSTVPSAVSQVARVVGHAVSADIIYFNPSQDYIEI